MTTNIFSIGLSGLQAAQIGIATAGENISNSSTAGYDVESADYTEATGQNSGSGYIGNGVTTATITRAYSQYLTTSLNNAQSTNSSLTASYNLATQLSNLVGSPTSGIASSITAFFTGMQTAANSPSDTSTLQTALSDAQTLAAEINETGQQYDAMRQSVNTQLSNAVSQVNTYSQQIAQLNTQIASATTAGQQPNQLLDERDQAVASLSQLVGVQVVQSNNGSYSVFLGNGQPLVTGAQSYSLTTQPSSTNSSEFTVAWSGLTGSTTTPQPLSSAALQGGTVGGLVSFVTQTLDPAQAQLGAIATSFAAQVNAQNEAGYTASGAAGGALFSVSPALVTGNTNNTGSASVAVTLTDPTQPPTDNYALSYSTASGTGTWTLTDTTTNAVVGSTTTQPSTANPFLAGGMSITSTGTMNSGDSYSIQPTANALDSFGVATTDASAIATSSPVLVAASSTNTGSATITQYSTTAGFTVPSSPVALTYTAPTAPATSGTLSGFPTGTTVSVTTPGSSTPTTVTIGSGTPPATGVSYDPSTGATITITGPAADGLNNVSFTMTGTPATNDTFTISANTGGTQDGSNALAIANLASSTAFTGTTTLTSAYASYVNSVGNTATQLDASSTSQQSLVTQLTSQQQSVEGVNMDEEAANLEQYQQLYQANAKVIQTAATMFQTLIGIFAGA
ncbi:flagellar hook-associated protein FlgK [Paraburkholderia sp. B3]|uniref:flagellar hook-associated protein FlgK n=1 Tax=Paraburkholderia sp. B3 TaxID=3134791 RepID=UPI003981CC44